jgi:release factor glutamine methyltransferase
MSTYKELLQIGRERLKERGIADADLDAWYLLAHVYKLSRTDLIVKGDQPVSVEKAEEYLTLIAKRAKNIPLQYITGSQEFMGLEFEVNSSVLIPRQDTEILVEEVLKVSKDKTILDLCTGSGCIIISLAKLGRPRKAVALDISEQALVVAKANARRHQVEVELIQSDLFDQVEESFDIIVSNPPYIPTDEIRTLMPEVRDYEPSIALDGSEDGLIFYRRITSDIKRYLNKNGSVFFEIGYNQGDSVKQILREAGLTDIMIKKDFSGLDRVVSARRP